MNVIIFIISKFVMLLIQIDRRVLAPKYDNLLIVFLSNSNEETPAIIINDRIISTNQCVASPEIPGKKRIRIIRQVNKIRLFLFNTSGEKKLL